MATDTDTDVEIEIGDDTETDDTDTEDTETETPEPKGMDADEAERVRAALKKANAEAKNFRLQLDELKKATETDAEAAVRTAVEEAETRVTESFMSRLAAAEAKAELVRQGMTGAPDVFLKALDMGEVELSDDGDISGVAEQVATFKKEYPQLFEDAKKPPKADAGNKGGKVSGQTSAERLAALLES